MEYCPECGIGLSNAEKEVCYCRNCHCDFSPEAIKEKNEWNGRCKCGHLHSQHNPTTSINYTAGRCAVAGCNCRNFIHQPEPPNEAGERKFSLKEMIEELQNIHDAPCHPEYLLERITERIQELRNPKLLT